MDSESVGLIAVLNHGLILFDSLVCLRQLPGYTCAECFMVPGWLYYGLARAITDRLLLDNRGADRVLLREVNDLMAFITYSIVCFLPSL